MNNPVCCSHNGDSLDQSSWLGLRAARVLGGEIAERAPLEMCALIRSRAAAVASRNQLSSGSVRVRRTLGAANMQEAGGTTKRRVSFALALPIVLACGGLGAAAGWMFPPQVLMTNGDRPGNEIATSRTSDSVSLPAPTTERVEAAPQASDLPAPVKEIAEVHQAEPAQSSTPAPTSEPDAAQKSPIREGKKQRDHAETRKRHPAREAAATKRANPEEADERTPRQKSPSVISQIPVLGPVFGLLLP